ncbi:protein of unknown function [Azospirillum baldaniorum]|uniref:Uncharacterized protein n=1 Tax=Azospirillum baldaniorum TaxID=1064539 RepID=A0A9P1NKW8_9PROT|nr:protein of unknown function [Azospirillum baldaniorum]
MVSAFAAIFGEFHAVRVRRTVGASRRPCRRPSRGDPRRHDRAPLRRTRRGGGRRHPRRTGHPARRGRANRRRPAGGGGGPRPPDHPADRRTVRRPRTAGGAVHHAGPRARVGGGEAGPSGACAGHPVRQLQGPVGRSPALQQPELPRPRQGDADDLPGAGARRPGEAADRHRRHRRPGAPVAGAHGRPDPGDGAQPRRRLRGAEATGAVAGGNPVPAPRRDRQPRPRPAQPGGPRPLGRDPAPPGLRDGRHAGPLRLRGADERGGRRRAAAPRPRGQAARRQDHRGGRQDAAGGLSRRGAGGRRRRPPRRVVAPRPPCAGAYEAARHQGLLGPVHGFAGIRRAVPARRELLLRGAGARPGADRGGHRPPGDPGHPDDADRAAARRCLRLATGAADRQRPRDQRLGRRTLQAPARPGRPYGAAGRAARKGRGQLQRGGRQPGIPRAGHRPPLSRPPRHPGQRRGDSVAGTAGPRPTPAPGAGTSRGRAPGSGIEGNRIEGGGTASSGQGVGLKTATQICPSCFALQRTGAVPISLLSFCFGLPACYAFGCPDRRYAWTQSDAPHRPMRRLSY